MYELKTKHGCYDGIGQRRKKINVMVTSVTVMMPVGRPSLVVTTGIIPP